MNNIELRSEIIRRELKSRERDANNFTSYIKRIFPEIELTSFHKSYYSVLNMFATGAIRRLIITVPPQHGKSLGSSQLLPSYMLGLNPNLKIAIASYSASLAVRFSRSVQRLMTEKQYNLLFPHTKLPTAKDRGYTHTSSEFEIVGHKGSLIAVGREGSLTGNKVDCFILDDLYKDAMEGNSPTIRENCKEWYSAVALTRQHNESQELIVFTRWHQEDLIGDILDKEGAKVLTSLTDIDPSYKGYYILNYEAIKSSEPTELDPRLIGDPLWINRHNVELLQRKRERDAVAFECMYQGNPSTAEGLLYSGFNTYNHLPSESDIIKRGNYTDTADMGTDYLCSVCYVKTKESKIYITDVIFTKEPMEVTEQMVAKMLQSNNTKEANIESNNGGRGFARAVQRYAPGVRIMWFHQSSNKEARILTNAAAVMQNIVFPKGWDVTYSEFYYALSTYRREFKANKHDDAADVVTGIVEKETAAFTADKMKKIKDYLNS